MPAYAIKSKALGLSTEEISEFPALPHPPPSPGNFLRLFFVLVIHCKRNIVGDRSNVAQVLMSFPCTHPQLVFQSTS